MTEKTRAQTFRLARCCGALFATLCAASTWASPKVEIMHWWQMPGELASIRSIEEAFTERGGVFDTVTTKDFSAQRGRVMERISMGFPPPVAQWVGGKDLEALRNFGALQPLPQHWREHKTRDLLFPEVLHNIEHESELWALPVGIHIHNTIYYQKSIYEQLALPLPKGWAEFIQQAEVIQKAGFTPLSVGDEPWQLQLVFNSILLEQVGVEGFEAYYDDHKSIDALAQDLLPVLAKMRQLRTYVDDAHIGRAWHESVDYFAAGKAAAHINGDYVKPELKHKGLRPQEDFYCQLGPGNRQMVYAFDVFALMRVKQPEQQAGQKLLFDTVISPAVQASYNVSKGSLPVRNDISAETLDTCAASKYRLWKDPETPRTISPSSANRVRRGAIEFATLQAWKQHEVPIEEVVSRLVDSIQSSLSIN